MTKYTGAKNETRDSGPYKNPSIIMSLVKLAGLVIVLGVAYVALAYFGIVPDYIGLK